FQPNSSGFPPLLELFVDPPLPGPTECASLAQSELAVPLFLAVLEPLLKTRTRTAACLELLETPLGFRRAASLLLQESALKRPPEAAKPSCIAHSLRPATIGSVLLMQSADTDDLAHSPTPGISA